MELRRAPCVALGSKHVVQSVCTITFEVVIGNANQYQEQFRGITSLFVSCGRAMQSVS
jgi:hypothetical protein